MSKLIHKIALMTLSAAFAVLVGLSAPAQAATQWALDHPHSHVGFEVQHVFAPVLGRFQKFTVDLAFDPKDLAGSKVKVSIETASINTDVEQRDKHLRSPDFFDVAKYPAMRFESKSIEHVKGDQYLAKGMLTIKGVSQPVDLPFRYLGQRPHPLVKGKQVAGFTARYTIDRLKYGVGDGKFYQMGAVGKDVKIYISLELLR